MRNIKLDELIKKYNITDPVQQGIIRWRHHKLKEWSLRVSGIGLEIGTGNYPCLAIFDSISKAHLVEPDVKCLNSSMVELSNKKLCVGYLTKWNQTFIENNPTLVVDLILSIESFEHIEKEVNFIGLAYKILKPGGYLIIETPNKSLTPLFEKALGYSPTGGNCEIGNEHINEVGFHELFTELRKNNFELIDFSTYYIPVGLWKDPINLDFLHEVSSEYPFYSYIQMFLARKK